MSPALKWLGVLTCTQRHFQIQILTKWFAIERVKFTSAQAEFISPIFCYENYVGVKYIFNSREKFVVSDETTKSSKNLDNIQ